MTISKVFRVAALAGLSAVAAVVFAVVVGGVLDVPGTPRLVTEAKAVVGRPLTPVSVAGVARRTSRRCAAGVYDC